jgi:uncharacterized membrane protein HdeD (DUF308 family)
VIFIVRDWTALLMRGLAAVAFGVLTLVWPGLTVWALVVLFGAFALVQGISILAAVTAREPGTEQDRWFLVLEGLAGIAAGIITLVWPGISALALLFVIAGWAFATGIFEIMAAVRLRHELRHEWLLALSGVLSIAFATLLVITPGAGALAITWLIGWYALFFGCALLALAWRVRREQAAGTLGVERRPPRAPRREATA